MSGDPVVKQITDKLYGEEPASGWGIDRAGIEIPDGWAVYFDGQLVFSVDKEKWQEIGPGIEKIMEG